MLQEQPQDKKRSVLSHHPTSKGKRGHPLEITRERRPESAEEVLEREIRGKKFKLGRSLGQEAQDQIAEVIAQHMDAFAWSTSDMPGIDPDFSCHRITMDPKFRPVR